MALKEKSGSQIIDFLLEFLFTYNELKRKVVIMIIYSSSDSRKRYSFHKVKKIVYSSSKNDYRDDYYDESN